MDDLAAANEEELEAFGVESTSCVVTVDEAEEVHSFAVGVSVRGELVKEGPNVLRGVSSAKVCHEECMARDDCTAFTWGRWRGCYLMGTVEAFVADSSLAVISGYKDCGKNGDLEAISVQARRLTETEPRDLATCGRAFKGVVYSLGSVLTNETEVLSADECWNVCRKTPDCFYMTFISIGSHDLHTCVLFDQVENQEKAPLSLGFSAEPNCDVLGQLEFESVWAASRIMRDIDIPLVATAVAGGTALLVLGGGVVLFAKRRSRKQRLLAESVVDGSSSGASINAFGMSPPSVSALSPNTVERGSPALQLDDFETKVDPNIEKSTGKRLRRYF
eukprot:Protomagalhaensia_wolfi_Nauph_80__1739@NODE_2082_length_1220_cov_64_695174_g1627_i0_p1_GENE_NODE_2082_length_1220_cov_64_695174_g1627_i0NODE_2082_length_1220_cov_64_695174_g1627_i0_p1_ORF_typecomplete_len377_score86_62PAN_4/PF14295_6/9_4e05PAN_4/PF14295_6/4_5e06PAN_1/PF00024_26/0_0018PAN_1/PF00024_26/0_022PAN_3/PF08277_12/1_3e04PAN_3/PF08277_12/0_065PAN_3/PF08277_12/0_019MANEC/PF07502_14/24MANEC/PF07502_14/0_0029PAN_2/PF08276_11/0_13PAN_2/PF08276_11/1_3e02DUF4340/PF14238_6/0_38Gram_pos_anchor/PF